MTTTSEHSGTASPLAEDLLRGVTQIAAYCGEPERRIRHLIARHGFPAFRRGSIIYSRKSWLAAYYGGEAAPAGVGSVG